MSVILFLSKRHLLKGSSVFHKLVIGVAVGGITLGVAALIVVLSVMNGFHKEVESRILRATPHIMVTRFYHQPIGDYRALMERVRTFREVTDVEPIVDFKAILREDGSMEGVVVQGVVEPPTFTVVSGDSIPGDGILIGKVLSDVLGIYVGDTVELWGVKGGQHARFFKRQLPVTGVFDMGLYEPNASLILVSLGSAQRMLGIGDAVTQLKVELKDPFQAHEVANRMQRTIGYPYFFLTWIDANANLFAALKLEKLTMFILLLLIIVVAAFAIAAILMMMVVRKTREIGVLRALGMTKHRIRRLFILEGLWLGIAGVVLGNIVGLLLCYLLGKYRFIQLPPEIYSIQYLPVAVEPFDVFWVSALTLLLALLASIYPAQRAASLMPAEAIRYAE